MKKPTGYLKMQVLAAIDYEEGSSRRERIKRVAERVFTDEYGKPHRFTWRTISTWYCRYSKHGLTEIQPKERADKGLSRKITPEELLEAINIVKPMFRLRKPPHKMAVYRRIIEKGLFSPKQLAQTTFYRFIREFDLLNDIPSHENKRRLAFAMQYANELWQMDTMYGPYVRNAEGKPVQTKLIAVIDDASRVICHGEFYFHETIESLVSCLQAAFYKRGVPDSLYCDNGGIYTSKEITLICARIGCILRHAPVRDGAAKGKIERFFRRVREQFLPRELDLSSLDKLNKSFTLWLEDEYNSGKHSGIGMKPVDRFALDIKRIRFLEPGQASDELFFTEDTRKVAKDNTFQLKSIRYEAPAYLHDKTITVRYPRNNPVDPVVFYKNKRIGQAKRLDLIANGKLKRERRAQS